MRDNKMSEVQNNAGQTSPNQNQTIVINQSESGNGVGTAGFILALITIFLGWVPVLGWILWALGLIFSFAGVFKNPKGMAIAGLVISLIGLIIILAIAGAIVGAIGALS
jgi:hypothetical protein